MNILIVLAHPEPQSFNAHLARVAHDAFADGHHAVQVSDLYASGFDPCEAGRHFAVRCDPTRFDAQAEQRFHWEQRSLPAEVEREAERLLWADLVILQFPLWWFGPPAILKGWMDRVFVYGGLYSGSRRHELGPCRGKRVLLSVTTGSSAAACSPDGREGDTRLILWPTLYALRYLGFTVLQPAIVYGVRGGLDGPDGDAQRQALGDRASEYRGLLQRIDDVPIVPFNPASDWDEAEKLTAGAPVYSPFIRHKDLPVSWPRGEDARAAPRYSARPLPRAAFVPGVSPRTARPAAAPERRAAVDLDALATDDDFRHGVDLFNHGFPWEAHEAWEPLWFAAPRDRPERALLHGLIHAAAAAVKAKAGALEAARGLVDSACEHLAGATAAVLELEPLAAALQAWAGDPARPPPTIRLVLDPERAADP